MTTRSRISYNIHGQNVPDETGLLTHLQALQPTSVLVMDGLGLAQKIKAMLPADTIIIHRNYGVTGGDDGIQDRPNNPISPEKWLELRAKEADAGVWLYVSNEPGYNRVVIDWHVKLMKLCIPRGIRLIIGNWAVGNPEPDQWPMAREILELWASRPDLFILGLHEYGCGVMTSGLVGGAPDDSRHADYIKVENWPDNPTASKLTRFHCGRFKFLLDYCKSINLTPGRILITEHGMDDVSDIKSWSSKLKVVAGYLNIRGWKTLVDQWRTWYGSCGWSPERAYFEQLRWADKAIYRGWPVEGQLIYCWGHSSQTWDQFDVAGAKELQSLLEDYRRSEAPPVEPPVVTPLPPVPTLPAFPPDFEQRAVTATVCSLPVKLVVRAAPSMSSAQIGSIGQSWITAWYIPALALRPNELVYETILETAGAWLPIETASGQTGWVFGGYLRVKELENPPPQVDQATVLKAVMNIKEQVDELIAYLTGNGKV